MVPYVEMALRLPLAGSMNVKQLFSRLAVVCALAAATACGSNSSTAPSAVTVSAVTLTSASVVAGGTVQATITLTAAAPAGGVTIAVSSSNPAVATVPASIAIAAGASSAAVTVTTVAQGTATITATLNGGSMNSPTLTATPGGVLASLSLSAANVVGGKPVTGTVTLTAAAPFGGAVVTLSGADPVTVPVSVTVVGGTTSASFTVTTRVVGGTIPATVTATYAGISKSAALSVTTVTEATASFGVTGPSESDSCTLTNSGNTLNCTFNGSTSTAPGTIVAWDWTFGVAKTFALTTTQPVLSIPAVDCTIVPAPPFPSGTTWFTMAVTLKVHDNQGNVSAVASNNGVRLFPQGSCGF